MGSQLALKGRIASTGSLEKIFNAQEMIASSHIAKARDVALNAKPYADAIFDAVQAVVAHTRITHPIVKKEEDNPKVAVLALTADRGMAGAYTSSIIRETEELLMRLDDAGKQPELYVYGRRGVTYYKYRNRAIADTWEGDTDKPGVEIAEAISNALMTAYMKPASQGGVSELYIVYTEFISADALVRYVPSTMRKMRIDPAERPVAIQIYGRDVETMCEAARIACQLEPDLLDLNFGCPVKRVAGKGAGSGMLRDPELLLEITAAVVSVASCPVTVKTRLGWDHNSLIITELAPRLQACGIAALTIHGRTRSDMYKGSADWTLIGEVRSNPKIQIPIIGNGDITTGEEVRHAFDTYGVDGVMVGRAAIGQPWIFGEMRAAVDPSFTAPQLTSQQQLEILKEIVHKNIEKLDERRGILHSRRHLAATPLFKGIPNFRALRIAMLQAPTLADLDDVLAQVEPLLPQTEGC